MSIYTKGLSFIQTATLHSLYFSYIFLYKTLVDKINQIVGSPKWKANVCAARTARARARARAASTSCGRWRPPSSADITGTDSPSVISTRSTGECSAHLPVNCLVRKKDRYDRQIEKLELSLANRSLTLICVLIFGYPFHLEDGGYSRANF